MSQNNRRKRSRGNQRNNNSLNSQEANSPYEDDARSPPLAFTPGTPAVFATQESVPAIYEDEEIVDEAVEDLPESEGEGEDLFGPNAEDDYNENPNLDRYDSADLDEQYYEGMDIMQRREVEQLLDERDRLNRAPDAILDNDRNEPHVMVERRRRRNLLMLDEFKDIEDDAELNLDFDITDLNDVKADSISVWITMEGPRRAIRKQFKDFIKHVNEKIGRAVYVDKIRGLVEGNKETLEISFEDLSEHSPVLAYMLTNAPRAILQIFDDVAFELVLATFPEYDKTHSEVHCRITHVPTLTSLRDLRQVHLNCLVKVFGIVSRRSSVFPQLKYVKFKCAKCSIILGPFYQDPSAPGEIKVGNCHNCDSKGPFNFCSEQTIYRNYQKITLQESPGTVPPGRLPRHREVILLWDLVDSIKPGDEIEVIGIYMNNLDASLNNKYGFPVFSTIIEANNIIRKNQETSLELLNEEQEKELKELSQDPYIVERIIHSIAPSIYGHKDIKTAIAMSLFGGLSKDKENNHRIRGDINVLLLGDPGTAKSQFLKYAEKTAHRCVYATGQGASAVGLTASVRKDPITREWTLEGGALVLADQGVCLIDEFDKMNEKDRTSIHEAMEQQTISISKAGIVTTLQARCSVIAAANPIRGRYNPTLPLLQNVDLTEPILSRFDLVCVVRDTVDPTLDFQLAEFVINSHENSHPDQEKLPLSAPDIDGVIQTIPQDILRKYITYARQKCKPIIYDNENEEISKLYSELRKVSNECGGLQISTRHLESIIRMAEAYARMHLHDHVSKSDFNRAAATFLESFIQTQKISVMKKLRNKFSNYLNVGNYSYKVLDSLLGILSRESIQLFQARRAAFVRDRNEMQLSDLDLMPDHISIPMDEFIARVNTLSIDEINRYLDSDHLKKLGFRIQDILDEVIEDGVKKNVPHRYLIKELEHQKKPINTVPM